MTPDERAAEWEAGVAIVEQIAMWGVVIVLAPIVMPIRWLGRWRLRRGE
jgi:hypothetical protein